MSVTIFIRGRHGIRQLELGKSWLFALTMLIFSNSALIFFGLQQPSPNPGSNHKVQYKQHQSLQDETQAQLSLLAVRLGHIQARMNRIESVGIAIVERTGLKDQFDFDSEIGLGGASTTNANDIELSQLLQQIDQISSRLSRADEQLALIATVEQQQHAAAQTYLSGRPVNKGVLTSHYGYRNNPFNGRQIFHKGVDYSGKSGVDIIATGAGVISFSGRKTGYGNLVEIDHGNGFKTRYGHNRKNLVKVGQLVTKGDVIAELGNTGRSTGPHVHYEVLKNNKQVNPYQYIIRAPQS